jgi:hypothetical protein
MKLLSESFTKGSVQYTQLRRDGNVALFKREKRSKNCNWIDFEVIRIQFRKGGPYSAPSGATGVSEDREVYPSDEDWGTHGFTFQTYEPAEKKYLLLLKLAQDAIKTEEPYEISTFSPAGCHIVPEQASGGLES